MARGDAFNVAVVTGVQYAAVRPLTLCMEGLAMLVVMCCLRWLARSCWLAMLAGKCITATDHARSKDGRSTGMSAAQNGSDIGSEDTSPVHLKLRIAIG